MTLNELTAISPLDGRYANKTQPLRAYFSEYALIYYRTFVEIHWLRHLTELKDFKPLSWTNSPDLLADILDQWSIEDAHRIKAIEKTTNHDVKAVEYYLAERLEAGGWPELIPYLHFGCTSEDINNLAYSLMIRHAVEAVIKPKLDNVMTILKRLAHEQAAIPMLARTHGQPASPTTLGKEWANTLARLKQQHHYFDIIQYQGKFSGATGNFNAHCVTCPELDWPGIAASFVQSLGLSYAPYTTQIEPHDFIADIAHLFQRINTILVDNARDVWGYIALGYFKQAAQPGEVGSSTMPHKVNPIDFENAEGNLGIANALLQHFAAKLPISRWQRDLSDSTVMRNLGSAFGYSLLAYESLIKGFSKLEANEATIKADLTHQWPVLGEALQTVMRYYGKAHSYNTMKQLTRGKTLDKAQYQSMVASLDLPESVKKELSRLQPEDYVGLAKTLAETIAY